MYSIMPLKFHELNLASHEISPFEAEEALHDGWNRRRKDGQNYEVLGRTGEGRYLQLVVEITAVAIRVFHGREMTNAERTRYNRK
jgi:uncharacterized DUF497 family protein